MSKLGHIARENYITEIPIKSLFHREMVLGSWKMYHWMEKKFQEVMAEK